MTRKPDQEVATLIELYSVCKEFGVLPYPGGVLNQPNDIMEGLMMVMAAVNEKLERDRKKVNK